MALPIGIIGLGQRWRKTYQPILRDLGELFRISAVCDALPERAVQEARRLGCAHAPGPTNLLQRADVAALLLLDLQWYRLWPVQVACRLGKPVFCDPSLESDDDHADALVQQAHGQTPPVPVMMALPFRLMAAGKFLRQLIDDQLGPVQAALTLTVGPRREIALSPDLAWLDLCSQFLSKDPVRAAATGEGEWSCRFFDDGAGGTIQLGSVLASGRHGPRLRRLTLLCARGTATADLPGLVHWTGPTGQHAACLKPSRSPLRRLLEEFHGRLAQNKEMAPSLQDAHRLLQWLRLARQGTGSPTPPAPPS